MKTTTDLRERVIAAGLEAGLDRVGITTTEPFGDVRRSLQERIESGKRGGLGFTFKDPELATDVGASFPWGRSLVVGARSYLPEAGTAPSRRLHGRVARFAVDDPYVPLTGALEAVAAALGEDGWRAAILVDDDRLVDRAAAVRAGVAWWGKSTMALSPGLGPWFVIGSVVTDAALDVSEPMLRGCGTCEACLPACPTGALVAPGVLDARRCLAAIAQVPGVIPREWREAMGDRLYGCDECLDVCPPGGRLRLRSQSPRGSVSLPWLLQASDDELLERFSHFYIPRRDPRYLRRNALVAAGNDASPDLFGIVAGYLGHRDWLLRAHAVWAIRRIDPVRSAPLLEELERAEGRPEVIEEMRLPG